MLVGRLLYIVGDMDNWQVGPFVKGIAGSGKSTLAMLIRSIFPVDSVGTLGTNIEAKFGLASLYDKLLYVCSEVKKDFALDQGDWQRMVSGEEVSVAIKGKTALSVKWEVPGILFGNELPGWVDASGSVVRRLLLFHFGKKVQNSDPHLLGKLKQNMGGFICKINRAYHEAVDKYGESDIWAPGILTDQLLQYHDDLKSEVDMLTNFLKSGAVLLNPTGYMLENEFKESYFSYHVTYDGGKRPQWCADHYSSVYMENGITILPNAALEYRGQCVAQKFLMGVCLPDTDNTSEIVQ